MHSAGSRPEKFKSISGTLSPSKPMKTAKGILSVFVQGFAAMRAVFVRQVETAAEAAVREKGFAVLANGGKGSAATDLLP